MSRPPAIYLAGPEVFLPDAREIGRRKQALCTEYGFAGLFPLDTEFSAAAGERLDRIIYRANLALIRSADLAIANLTPFRGSGADPGTVFELGLLTGLGKPVFGYTNDGADLLTRLRDRGEARFEGGRWVDLDGLWIEDFGNADNLMIDAGLAEAGAPLIRHRAETPDRFTDLRGFEACLKLARARFGRR